MRPVSSLAQLIRYFAWCCRDHVKLGLAKTRDFYLANDTAACALRHSFSPRLVGGRGGGGTRKMIHLEESVLTRIPEAVFLSHANTYTEPPPL